MKLCSSLKTLGIELKPQKIKNCFLKGGFLETHQSAPVIDAEDDIPLAPYRIKKKKFLLLNNSDDFFLNWKSCLCALMKEWTLTKEWTNKKINFDTVLNCKNKFWN